VAGKAGLPTGFVTGSWLGGVAWEALASCVEGVPLEFAGKAGKADAGREAGGGSGDSDFFQGFQFPSKPGFFGGQLPSGQVGSPEVTGLGAEPLGRAGLRTAGDVDPPGRVCGKGRSAGGKTGR
jgi:hypothetical protein